MLQPKFDHYYGQSVVKIHNDDFSSFIELESGVRFIYVPSQALEDDALNKAFAIHYELEEGLTFTFRGGHQTSYGFALRVPPASVFIYDPAKNKTAFWNVTTEQFQPLKIHAD
jgi:hypothetical protein